MTIPVDSHACGFKRTKIVATLGPACEKREILEQMILCGVNVFRINFSHYDPGKTETVIATIRELSQERAIPVGLLGDLRGPHLRVGDVKNGTIELQAGRSLLLTPEVLIGDEERVTVSYPGLANDLRRNSTILVDNGMIILHVERIESNGGIQCLIMQGGSLSSRRGINLPGTIIGLPALTDKDYRDVDYAIAHDLDFLALSFVQSAADVRLLKSYLKEQRTMIPVIAKIENQGALINIGEIAAESNGVMVARGDLALEMSIQDVPIAQKKIISACRLLGVPVITATQMLETMIGSNQPTRAEATDIANAILDGTDALMLSGETAIGKYPLETIEVMTRIARKTEEAWIDGQVAGPAELAAPEEIDSTIAYASTVIARNLKAGAIVTHTTSGSTARRVSRHRPFIPVLALTASERTRRWLTLCWGVESVLAEEIENTDQLIESGMRHARETGLVSPGDALVITAGMPFHVSGKTNLIKVEKIPS